MKSQDHEEKWAKKVADYKEKILADDPEYQREERFDGLIAFLFSEVWDTINNQDERSKVAQVAHIFQGCELPLLSSAE